MTSPVSSPQGGAPGTPFTSAVAGGQMGKNEFLKLLVAQMTHQDPLNPLDGQEMASQLAQFSSVEQLMNLGTKLDAQSANHEALLGVVNNTAAVGLIGRTVMVADDRVQAGPGGTVSGSVIVPPDGGRGTLAITDADGKVVRTIDLGDLDAGERTLDLAAGLDGLPAGEYRIAVEVEQGGETAALVTRVAVTVEGVRLSANGAFVTAGSISYPIGLIDGIRAANTPT